MFFPFLAKKWLGRDKKYTFLDSIDNVNNLKDLKSAAVGIKHKKVQYFNVLKNDNFPKLASLFYFWQYKS